MQIKINYTSVNAPLTSWEGNLACKSSIREIRQDVFRSSG